MKGFGSTIQKWAHGVIAAAFPIVALAAPNAAAAPALPSSVESQTAADCQPSRPDTYLVSNLAGVLPEGIGLTKDRRTMYVTSFSTGAVYRGDIRHRRLQLFAPAGDAGRTSAAGVHVDRDGRVFVAGRTALDVYSEAGRLLAHRPAPAGEAGDPFLNDLVITRTAVYITDSVNAVVYRAAVNDSDVGPLQVWFDARTVQQAYPAYYWYLNGIVADPAGKTLLVAAQGIGALIRIDVDKASGAFVDTGQATLGADGLLLAGRHTLYAVLNYEPPTTGTGVYQLRLSADWRTATHLQRLPDPGLVDPTTIALDNRHRLLVVNSQLERAPGNPPYTVTAICTPHHH